MSMIPIISTQDSSPAPAVQRAPRRRRHRQISNQVIPNHLVQRLQSEELDGIPRSVPIARRQTVTNPMCECSDFYDWCL